MITRVWSDLPNFREVIFTGGMNVVLADRAKDSDENESTNGLGKTTLLRIIKFCLGSDLARDKVLKHPRLKFARFGLDLTYLDRTITAVRAISSPEHVLVTELFISGLDLQAEPAGDGLVKVSLEDWKRALTLRFVPSDQESSPSFNELALYLIRLGKPAFIEPPTAFQGQSGASKRLIVSYLLGLNWASQVRLDDLVTTRSQVDAAIKALKGAADTQERSIGELEAERVALEASVAAKREEVERFNVREDYRDLENALVDVDARLHAAINENFSDKRVLDYYTQSADELPAADPQRPVDILKDAGAIFREDALKSLDEVAAFHLELHTNRHTFLHGEISRLKGVIKERNSVISSLADRKSEILEILRSSGALEQLIELQRGYVEQKAQLEALKARIAERIKFDLRKEDLTSDISHQRSLMKRDLSDRARTVDEARLLFAEYTQFLYGKPGGLSVDVTSAGYRFTFSIDREGSDGVDQMVVFCFDLAVATLRARRKSGFSTLIHDSAMFADVDPRQYGLALQLAKQRSEIEGFQYICCLNSGALPTAHLGDLDMEELTKLRLTDEGEEGRLLGIRLPPREQAT